MRMDWGLARDCAARDVYTEETPVTEAEWLAATNPRLMLNFLRGKASAPKLGLYACACVRRVWHLLDDRRSREAVEAVENEAMQEAELHSIEAVARQTNGDHYVRIIREPVGVGRWTARALQAAASAATAVLHGSPVYNNASRAHQAAEGTTMDAEKAVRCAERATGSDGRTGTKTERSVQAIFLRDVVGNPFRPAPAVDPAWLECHGGTVAQLAHATYENRRLPEGTLEPVRLSLLADALEDAGCTDAELLGHLRSPGPHVRGCWAVDLVLGKS
jgi:hypothetical protein